MIPNIVITFCTYFKKIERFKYENETYEDFTAFCLKKGSFSYRIGDEKEEILSEGEIVFCPPNHRFSRKIIEPAELCMIKFIPVASLSAFHGKIRIYNIFRLNDNLRQLENCLFCDDLAHEPLFSHYCMDILFLALDGVKNISSLSSVKKYMEQNFDKGIHIHSLAKQAGYTTPHFINKFKAQYGVTPKTYIAQIKIMKAKQLLMMSDKLSREIAYELGFVDELYFIRFFKKHTMLTPRQFREQNNL